MSSTPAPVEITRVPEQPKVVQPESINNPSFLGNQAVTEYRQAENLIEEVAEKVGLDIDVPNIPDVISEIIAPFQTTDLQAERYRARLKTLGTQLENMGEEVQLGPKYTVADNKGREFLIETLTTSTEDEYAGNKREYFLIARDPQGEIMGDLHTTISTKKGEKQSEAIEFVEAYQQNKGVGTALEEAHIDILQRESNDIGPIVWEARNQNAERLDALKKVDTQDMDEETKSAYENELKDAEAQQVRWQKMYGEDGRFGLDSEGRRIFSPQEGEAKTIGQIEEIKIVVDSKTKLPVISETTIRKGDEEIIETRKVDEIIGKMKDMSKTKGVLNTNSDKTQ